MGFSLLQQQSLISSLDARNHSCAHRSSSGKSTFFSSKATTADSFPKIPERKKKPLSVVAAGKECVKKAARKWLSNQHHVELRITEYGFPPPRLLPQKPPTLLSSTAARYLNSSNVCDDDAAAAHSSCKEKKRSLFAKAARKLTSSGRKRSTTARRDHGLIEDAGVLEVFDEGGCETKYIPCAARGSDKSSGGHSGKAKIVLGASASAALAVKGVQLMNARNTHSGLEANLGSGNSGNGNGGWGGGGGGNGDGSGNFDAGSGESFYGDLVYPADSQDDDVPNYSESGESFEQGEVIKHLQVETAFRSRNLGMLASLSSAAGESIDGEAPFGDDGPKGRSIRNGLGEEVDHIANHMRSVGPYTSVKVPSKTPGANLEIHPGGSAGGVPGGYYEREREGARAQDCLNFLDPTDSVNDGTFHQKSAGIGDGDPRERDYRLHDGSAEASPSRPSASSSYGGDARVRPHGHKHLLSLPNQLLKCTQWGSPGAGGCIPGGGPVAMGQDEGRHSDFFDWFAGLFHSVGSKRTDGQGSSRGAGKAREQREREALALEAAEMALLLLGDRSGDEAFVKRSETGALRRLQREAFSDLLKVRERLDKLEHHTGLRRLKTAPLGDPAGVGKTRLKGEVSTGSAFVLLQDSGSRYSRAALEQAGLHTGLDVRFTFKTPFRGKDMLITECSAGHAGGEVSILGGPISVKKIIYSAQITDDLTLVVAPLGARGSNMTETVNPLQGQALTEFASVGPALFNHCKGSALGATLKGRNALLSVSQYLSNWATGSSLALDNSSSGPLCLSTLAQVMFQPWENSVFSLSAVNRFWPSPPLPSSAGLHWSEMGPLVLSKTLHSRRSSVNNPSLGSADPLRSSNDNPGVSSASAPWGSPFADNDRGGGIVPESHGTTMQSVALAGEIDVIGNVSLGGWAQVERGDWLHESEKKDVQWGMSLAKTSGKTVDWGLCVGSSKVDLWSVGRSNDGAFPGSGDGGIGEAFGSQLQAEAFMKLSCGHGFTLQPGLVYLLNKHSQTPAFMLRTSWTL